MEHHQLNAYVKIPIINKILNFYVRNAIKIVLLVKIVTKLIIVNLVMICNACVYEAPKRFTNPMTSVARVELCYP